MKCPKCSYDNKDDALNCGLCGEIIKSDSSESSESQPEAQSSGGVRSGKSCPNHPDKGISLFCESCRKDFCDSCLTEVNGKRLCPSCQGKGLAGQTAYYRRESTDSLKGWWTLLGAALIINYLLPISFGMGSGMLWSAFKAGFVPGVAALLPTLVGILIVIMAVMGQSMIRGAIISLVMLGSFIFYYVSFDIQMDILNMISLLSFIAMLVGASLRKSHKRSDLAKFLAGISGIVYLIAMIIFTIQIFSNSLSSMAVKAMFSSTGSGGGFITE